MERIFIGVGSNIQPESNVLKALRLIAQEVRLLKISTFYLTVPEGRPDQPLFYNGALEIRSTLPPWDLKMNVLRSIEAKLGRVRTDDKNAPRTIDLDILLHGGKVLEERGLIVPDPQIPIRPFLVVPLSELAPEMRMPGSHLSLKEIAQSLDKSDMKPLEEFTLKLRERCGDQLP